ncbi:hypothetical protein JI721_01720 [Alicyclobacillus cycloheptanicus]|nr:hypothetical protein JI721_01720 [Alicyclobacillus cycloheptanicus]
MRETFLRVLHSRSRFHHQSNPKTGIWSIVNNCMLEYVRKQKRRLIRSTTPRYSRRFYQMG